MILDEAVSALDKSVEAQVLNLLLDLKAEFGLTYLFISHDLNVVRYMSDRVMVMYLGKIAEIGPVEAIYGASAHPYTRALLSAMPTPGPRPAHERAAARRRPAQPDRSAAGLPLPRALHLRRGGLRARRSRRAAGIDRPSRRLPHVHSQVRPQPARSVIEHANHA